MELPYPLMGVVALLLAAAFFLAGWGYGRLLLRPVSAPRRDRPLIEVALGTGLLGYLAFGLGLVGLLRPWALGLVLLGGLFLAAASWRAVRRSHPPVLTILRGLLHGAVARASAAVVVLAALFALLGAMLPEIEYDALWYHLTFPARYLSSGWLLDLPCDHMSPAPQHVELLYSFALLFHEARAAKLVHLGFGALAAAWTGLLAWRTVGPRWALLAAALLLSAPTVLWEMTTVYNELPLTFVATGSVALLLAWWERGDRLYLALAALLLGIGLAGKHLAFFFLAPLALAVLLLRPGGERRSVARRVLDAALLCGLALLVALPWYLRAWYYTGNPLYPMFYDLMAGLGLELQRWDAQAQRGWDAAMARYGHGRSLPDLLLLPWRMTWDGVAYAGSLGPAWLLFLPLLPLVWRSLDVRVRLLAGLGIVFLVLWASPYSSFQLRYLVPVVPVLSVVVAAVVAKLLALFRLAGWPAARLLLQVAVLGMLLLNLPLFYPLAHARTGWIAHTLQPYHPAWSTSRALFDPDAYLRQRLEPYRAVQYINAELPPTARIAWFAEAAHFYARPELVADHSRCVADGIYAPPGDEERAYRLLREAGVTHVAWDKTRTDVHDERLAVRSPVFRQDFAIPIYSDAVVEIYELRERPADAVTESAEVMAASLWQGMLPEAAWKRPIAPWHSHSGRLGVK